MKYPHSSSLSALRGFTLVELLVTFALFTSIITIATGALFSAQAINVRLEQSQVIFDGVNLAMETMTRDIRYGREFHCDTLVPTSAPTTRKSCPYSAGGGTVLIFKEAAALSSVDRVVYYINNNAIYKDEYVGSNPVATSRITSNDVTVDSLVFYVDGAQSTSGLHDVGSASDYAEPVITLSLSGVTKPPKTNVLPVRFSVQTTISARGVDN